MSVGAINKSTGDRIPTAGMPAIDDALDLTSVNPVQNAVITAALANKQDKTDNNLETTSKTVVGAVNELKSGLTNYEATTNAALALPENAGRNILPLTLANLKSVNTTGTWADNVYTLNNVDFTVIIDNDGRVSGITANGTASANTNFFFVRNSPNIYSGYILNGSVGGSGESYYMALSLNSSPWTTNTCYNSDTRITIPKTATIESYIRIANAYAANNVTFYPMIRPATITDPAFAPYIPSVDSRIEAVESGKQDKTDNTLTTAAKTVVGAINELNGIFIHHDFSGPNTKEIITSLIAFIRDNTQTGHTYVLDGLFTDTTTTTTHYYNAVVTKMSSYVYGIVSYGNNIYNIDYLAGTYKTIMQFTGTAL